MRWMMIAAAALLVGAAGVGHAAERAAAPAGPVPGVPAGDDEPAPSLPVLSAAETAWHLRAALTVAALGCHGDAEAARHAGYAALLAQHRRPLADALAGTKAAYRNRYAASWRDRFDGDMTTLSNHWAEPGAHDAFCAAADGVLADASVTEPADFGRFAAAALPQLEAPFLATAAASERDRREATRWQVAVGAAQMAAVGARP